MASSTLHDVLQHMRCVWAAKASRDFTDSQLLERFLRDQDETAFGVLMQRHGPLVLGVCRRLTGDSHLAEDSFQGTFMVLARRAASIRKKVSLASWLYGVAQHIAARAKAQATARRVRERRLTDMPDARPLDELTSHELQNTLDAEIGSLPEKYRAPLVLCYLEGKTHDAAALELRWPKTTVTNRLSRGRELLRKRLIRRGFTLSAGALVSALSTQLASASITARLTLNTVRAAMNVAGGASLAAAGLSARAILLAEAGMKATAGVSGKIVALIVMISVTVGGAGLAGYGGWQERADEKPTKPKSELVLQTLPKKDVVQKKDTPAVDSYGDPLPAGAIARLGTTRFRHGGEAADVAFSPDGKVLAAKTQFGVMVWDATNGKEIFRLPVWGHVDISPDGATLAVLYRGMNGTSDIGFFELHSGKQSRTLTFPGRGKGGPGGGGFASPRFASDGKKLFFINIDTHKVEVLDLASGEIVATMESGNKGGAYNFAISPDGKMLLMAQGTTGDPGSGVQLRDVVTGKMIRDFKEEKFVRALAFSPDGKWVAFGTTDRVSLFDRVTGNEFRQLEFEEGQVTGIAFTPDGKTLIAGSESDGKIRVWDIETGKVRHTWDGRMFLGRSMALSRDGKTVAMGALGQTVRLWDVNTATELFTEFQGHDSQINCLAFSPDNKTLASGGDYKQTWLWDIASRKQVALMPNSARTLSFSPDGKRLALVPSSSTSRSVKVNIWELPAAIGPSTITVPDTDEVRSVVFSPDGRKLIILDQAFRGEPRGTERLNRVRHWDAATLVQDQEWVIPQKMYTPFLAQDGRTVLAGIDNGVIRIHDTQSGRNQLFQGLGEGPARALLFSSDGRMLVSMAGLQTADFRVWEVISGKVITYLKGNEHVVNVLAFSPDGRLVAAGESRTDMKATQTVRLWDAGTGKEIARFEGFKANVTALTFSSDGVYLAAGLKDSSILMWDLRNVVPKLAGRKLDAKELDAHWSKLADNDAKSAYESIWQLIDAPEQSVPYFGARLKPVGLANAAKVQQYIADLNSDKFAVREAALNDLLKFGGQIEPAIQNVLKDNPPLETRRRLELVLNKLHDAPEGDILRSVRAVMVLEKVGTPEALVILQLLAQGAPAARETEEAKSALARLAK